MEQLDVPPYELEQLKAHGLVACRTYRVDALGVKVWFLKEDLDLLIEAGLAEPSRRHCSELTKADYDF